MIPVYRVDFSEADAHRLTVELEIAATGRERVELELPVWTPGSYKVRDFARHLEPLTAVDKDGDPVAVRKLAKSRWEVATGASSTVVVRYCLWANELTVRTNAVGEEFALLAGAATFVVPSGHEGPLEVELVGSERWPIVVTTLERSDSSGRARFRASSYDELVDSPIYAGAPLVDRFDVDGTTYELFTDTRDDRWPRADSVEATRRIVETVTGFWGVTPYDSYQFVNLVGEGYGGLEHASCTILMFDQWKARTREGWTDWLGLVCHELFHAWNVKRLRPRDLGPFDYGAEVYTRQLWVAEGITSYYDDLLVHRAGLTSEAEYLGKLSKTVRDVGRTPGREVRSLEEASFDAWIKLYQPDENTINSSISYYRKGALAAWILDERIRRASGDELSLDDVMRAAFERFSGESGFDGEQLRDLVDEVCSERCGCSLRPLIDSLVTTTDELPLEETLAELGLRYVGPPEEVKAWLGAATKAVEGRLVLQTVRRGSAAAAAGLDAGDEIVALDGFRVGPADVSARLAAFRPDDDVEITYARRSRLATTTVTLEREPGPTEGSVEVDPDASPEAVGRRRSWLAS